MVLRETIYIGVFILSLAVLTRPEAELVTKEEIAKECEKMVQTCLTRVRAQLNRDTATEDCRKTYPKNHDGATLRCIEAAYKMAAKDEAACVDLHFTCLLEKEIGNGAN